MRDFSAASQPWLEVFNQIMLEYVLCRFDSLDNMEKFHYLH